MHKCSNMLKNPNKNIILIISLRIPFFQSPAELIPVFLTEQHTAHTHENGQLFIFHSTDPLVFVCFLVFVLSGGCSWGLLWWSALAYNVPLKLGLMRASYPDVFPMSLSRKSEGDSCGPVLPGGFISSLQELSLTLGGRAGTNTKRKKREDLEAVGVGRKKIMRIQQNEKPTAITKSAISKKILGGRWGNEGEKLWLNGLPHWEMQKETLKTCFKSGNSGS